MSESSIALSAPFSREIEVYFESPAHQEAYVRLQMMVKERYLGVLTGEVGSGKSTLIRKLFHSLDPLKYQTLYICIANLKPREFYGELLRHLGEEPQFLIGKAKRIWEEMIAARQTQGEKQLVVVIDEAQDLSPSMILELRFVMSQHMDSTSPITIILVGQPELRKTLRMKRYEAIAQRVGMQYHLTGMNKEQTMAYIRHQLKVTETTSPVFSESAMQLIFTSSQGIARVVNHICTQALFEARSKNLEVVEENLIGRILSDHEKQR